MAKSKRTGRYYESRRDRGYVPDKRRKKRDRYPKGFDRWGDPNTCGVVDEATGKECPNTVIRGGVRCEYHQELHDHQFGHPEKLRLFQSPQRRDEGAE